MNFMTNFSIIQKSQLEGAMRLDAEYYQPEYLELEKDLKEYKDNLKSFREVLEKGNSLTGGATPLGANYSENGIKFLRVQNIMPGYLDFSDIVFIEKKIHEGQLGRSKLINGDILLTITGISYGKAALYRSEYGESNINQHSVRMHFQKDLLPEYVSMFLNSKYGKFQSDRKVTGNTRPALAYEEIKNFQIPVLDIRKQLEIKNIFDDSSKITNDSALFYQQAENLLLEKLNFKNFDIKENLSTIINFSNVLEAQRMDAEYFQDRYDKLVSKIKDKGAKKLGDIVSMKKGFEPGSEEYQEEGKLFIRVSSLSKNGIKNNDQKYLSDKLYKKLKKDYEPKRGEILLTKDATPGIAYLIKENMEGIISGGILCLKLKENINGEYLALCLNSIVGKMQAERDAGGSVIKHWKSEQIRNVLIPILSKETQEKIADLVQKSHEAQKKARELLEEAKRRVEEMIENQN